MEYINTDAKLKQTPFRHTLFIFNSLFQIMPDSLEEMIKFPDHVTDIKKGSSSVLVLSKAMNIRIAVNNI